MDPLQPYSAALWKRLHTLLLLLTVSRLTTPILSGFWVRPLHGVLSVAPTVCPLPPRQSPPDPSSAPQVYHYHYLQVLLWAQSFNPDPSHQYQLSHHIHPSDVSAAHHGQIPCLLSLPLECALKTNPQPSPTLSRTNQEMEAVLSRIPSANPST